MITIKREEHFIKSQTLIDIIDNIERLVRALRKAYYKKMSDGKRDR